MYFTECQQMLIVYIKLSLVWPADLGSYRIYPQEPVDTVCFVCGRLSKNNIVLNLSTIVKIYIAALDPRELTLELFCVTGFQTV